MKRYQFYISSEEAWTAMLEAIRRATRSIYWEIYIFNNDTGLTHDFIAALEGKARSGVTVKIIADGFGSIWFNRATQERLRKAGVEVLFYTNLWYRTHRKILIVDETTAFIGGVNIGENYRKWADLHLRLSGPAVRPLLNSLARFYELCGGKDLHVLAYAHASPLRQKLRKTKMRVLDHWPNIGRPTFPKIYRQFIAEAKRRIVIITPYFIPPRWLSRALGDARKRHVAIDIILPRATDPAYLDVFHRIFAEELAPLGVMFYFSPEMMHAKAIIIDGEDAIVGSQNVDPVSFGVTTEVGLEFRHKKMIKDLEKIAADWKRKSMVFNEEIYGRRWYYPLARLAARLLTPLIL